MLTERELRFLALTAELANIGHEITGDTCDWNEMADKIHQLQRMVMSQAAARQYQHKFRLLGGTL